MAEGHAQNGENRLLSIVKEHEPNGFMRSLDLVFLETRHKVYMRDQPIEHVYFPVNGVISMLALLEEDVLVEVATVGNEGMVGLPLFLGAESTPGEAFSQVPGQAYRMPAARFKEMIHEASAFTAMLHRYTQALMTQISQGTACNRCHSNHQRCARWLLLTHDRVGKDEFSLTQEFLAQMLGVRRGTVNEVAGKLQAEGIINYSRGVIRITDRKRLEAASCHCYEVIRDDYDRMFADLASPNGDR